MVDVTQEVTQSIASTADRHEYDVLELRVEWQDVFEGGPRGYLHVQIEVNGEHVRTYATDPHELSRSVQGSREYYFNTCPCGWPGCADIKNGVLVRHEPGTVLWYMPNDWYVSEYTARRLRRRPYRFEYGAYRAEVIGCLKKLAAATRRESDDVMVMCGFDASEWQRSLDELLRSAGQKVPVEGSPQERLLEAIEKGESGWAQCAIVDGADLLLLQGNDAECPWERAVYLHGVAGYGYRGFSQILANYLPVPVAPAAGPEHLLARVVEDGYAELLCQVTAPAGPLALNEDRAHRCREQLETMRAERKLAKSVEIEAWESSLNERRERLEIEMKLEALDRSIKAMRDGG